MGDPATGLPSTRCQKHVCAHVVTSPIPSCSPVLAQTPFWTHLFQYFNAKHVIECDLKPDRQYIVGVHPHGIHCMPLGMFSWLRGEWARRFPHHKMVGAAASVIFFIPVLREIFLYSGYAALGVCTIRSFFVALLSFRTSSTCVAHLLRAERGLVRTLFAQGKRVLLERSGCPHCLNALSRRVFFRQKVSRLCHNAWLLAPSRRVRACCQWLTAFPPCVAVAVAVFHA